MKIAETILLAVILLINGIISILKNTFDLIMTDEADETSFNSTSYSYTQPDFSKANNTLNRTVYIVMHGKMKEVCFSRQEALHQVELLSSPEYRLFMARAAPDVSVSNEPVQIMAVPDLDVPLFLLGEVTL